MMTNIAVYIHGSDYDLFAGIINQGIDSRLEAFTKSQFKIVSTRLEMDFHDDELQILLRRLCEQLDSDRNDYDYISSWIDDILYTCYGLNMWVAERE